MSGSDVEKAQPVLMPEKTSDTPSNEDDRTDTGKLSGIQRYMKHIEHVLLRYNVEARGIQRVLPAQRHTTDHLGFAQICMLWVSINLTANNTTLGMLGPTVFSLPFLDSCLCAVFGMFVGCLPVAYIATFGPRSGNRTMVLTRYIMGWWPSKIIVVLTLIILLGYSLIDVVVAGQILSAVSTNNSLSIVVRTHLIFSVLTYPLTGALGRHHHHWSNNLGHHNLRLQRLPPVRTLRLVASTDHQHAAGWSRWALLLSPL
jgi:hypothetical protein